MQGVERGAVAGNVYKNDALSLAYEFPRNWIAAKPEVMHQLNEKMEAAAKPSILQQHPELAENLRIMTPKIVFYAVAATAMGSTFRFRASGLPPRPRAPARCSSRPFRR